MVGLTEMREWNNNLVDALPESPVAVFAGATKGIGLYTLRAFVQHTANLSPRIYFIGRSKKIGEDLVKEFEQINPKGTFVFLPTDLGLMKAVDATCKTIVEREGTHGINLLIMSQGIVDLVTETSEGLRFIYAVTHLSKVRIAQNLLPCLQRAQGLRRVVSVFTGTKEGPIIGEDWELRDVKFSAVRGSAASIMTLALEQLAKDAPDVSFVHNFPGFVNTSLFSTGKGLMFTMINLLGKIMNPFICMSDEDCGTRHVFIATTQRFPPKQGTAAVKADQVVAKGTDGVAGSGVYSVDENAEAILTAQQLSLLEGYRKDGKMAAMHDFQQMTLKRICG